LFSLFLLFFYLAGTPAAPGWPAPNDHTRPAASGSFPSLSRWR
jgi:hypothetical protein